MRAVDAMPIVIGGVVGTAAEHVALMREEGQTDRCIDYFVGHALSRAVDGWTPGPAACTVAAYRADRDARDAARGTP